MLKIGDFSKLTHVSIRMLRHYDEIGLLKPAHIERENGYRYYSADQLPRLHRILAMQDMGFSLRQISSLMKQSPSLEQMRGMLLQKQAELEDQMRAEQERLARVAARLSQIEAEGVGAQDVVVKQVPNQWVASVRDKISSHQHISILFERLFAILAPMGLQGLSAVIWHDDSFQEETIDAEALVYLSHAVTAPTTIRIYELPGEKMATVVHHGSYTDLPIAYDGLVQWLDRSGYQVNGANRELYLHYKLPSNPNNDSYITEIQFPIVPNNPIVS